MTTTMWEVRAAEGCFDDLVGWLRAVLPDARQTDVYASADERLVVIATGEEPLRLPEPPADLVRRAPHQWGFRRIEL
ncbi:hypothetical protein [Kineococcus sp. SYSU DK003]|uniref:hypothetical protein n=1 Tax=Kineococcus sp. SYSU DK003 TaxID=3383124 RepID=UPI003D7D44B1